MASLLRGDWTLANRLRVRAQNLNEKPGDLYGSIWKHGRAWLHRVKPDGESAWPPIASFSWFHGRLGLDATLSFDRHEREVTAHVAGPGASYFVSVPMPNWLVELLPWKHRRREYFGWERTIGVRVFGNAIWLSFWEDSMSWHHDDPWWYRATIHVDDLLLGKKQYSTREIEKRPIQVPMPEGTYEGTATLELSTWKRPRWPWRPFSIERLTVKIDVPEGIGKPGKGENSWDCGSDATYGMSTEARSIEDGIGKLVASVLRDRVRYGGGHRDTGGHTPTVPSSPESGPAAPATSGGAS